MYGQPQGYPPQPGQPGYYPPQQATGYPPQGPGYQAGYPPQQQQGYPPQQQGYNQGYPPQQQGYPQGYPPQQQGYPQQQQYSNMNVTVTTNGPQLQSGQEYTLRFGNGNYFTAEPNGTYRYNANAIGDWEKFRLNNEGNNRWSLRTAHGKVVCYDQGKNCFDVRDGVGDWERFEFHPSGNGAFHMHCPAQRVFFNFDQGYARDVPDQYQASHIYVTPVGYGGQQQYGGQPQGHHGGGFGYQGQPIQGQMRPGFYNIRNHHGRYIEATRDRFNQSMQPGHNERFYVEGLPGNNFAIRVPSENNRVVCLGSNDRLEYRDGIGAWETLEIRSVPGHPHRFNIYCPAQRKFVRCDANAFNPVDLADSPGEWEQFEFIPVQ